MGFWPVHGMLRHVPIMTPLMRRINGLLAAALMAFGIALTSEAKSYSGGGGHSYSSHSSSFGGSHSFSSGSHSFSSGSSHSSGGGSFHTSSSSSSHASSPSGGKSYKSSSGSSYSSGSIWSDTSRHSYTSGKSYSSGSSGWFGSGSSSSHADSGSLTFDTAAARARKEADEQGEVRAVQRYADGAAGFVELFAAVRRRRVFVPGQTAARFRAPEAATHTGPGSISRTLR